MSKRMRPPKKLAEFTSAEEAARGLEDMAREIRGRALITPLVRYSVSLSFWNPEWVEIQPGVICLGVTYANASPTVTVRR